MIARTRKRILVASVSLLAALALGGLVVEARRATPIYFAQKSGRGWSGSVHEADPELGFRLVRGGRGFECLSIGPPVPVWIDADGFRTPAPGSAEPQRARPLVLALGCSFTFGSCCNAEETWPFLVARGLDANLRNGGVCSYGAAQILILARRLVPELRPDVLLLQYSPWHLDRARRRIAPTFGGVLPTPWFAATSEGPRLRPPDFAPRVFELPLGEYRNSRASLLDFLSFQCRVGIPLLLHDDGHRAWDRIHGGVVGLEPPATSEDIADCEADEIVRLCAEHRTRLVVVVLTRAKHDEFPDPWSGRGCLVVDARSALFARLESQDEPAYRKAYAIWRGNPPVIVDEHPNPRAHAVIAETVLAAIGSPAGETAPR